MCEIFDKLFENAAYLKVDGKIPSYTYLSVEYFTFL
jgi:hypothetical protein